MRIATTQRAAMSGLPYFVESGRFENPYASNRQVGDWCDHRVWAPTSRSSANPRCARRPDASPFLPAANPICLDVGSGRGPCRRGPASPCGQAERSAQSILYRKGDTVSLQANELPANCSGSLQRGCNHHAFHGDRDHRRGCGGGRRLDVGLQDGASCR